VVVLGSVIGVAVSTVEEKQRRLFKVESYANDR